MNDSTLDLYTGDSPNGRAPAILLAELQVPYGIHLVRPAAPVALPAWREAEQPGAIDAPFSPGPPLGRLRAMLEFEANPSGRVPVLVDSDPHLGRSVVFGSGAVLQFLAEKHQRFVPLQLGALRAEVLSWLSWQVGETAPLARLLDEPTDERSRDEPATATLRRDAERLVSALDRHLVDREVIAEQYSIADMACYPWFHAIAERFPDAVEHAHELRHWLSRIGRRPAVKRGMRFAQLAEAA